MKSLIALALVTALAVPAMARERAMVKLPIIYVMLGFQFLGAPPDTSWSPMGVYASKAECMAGRRRSI